MSLLFFLGEGAAEFVVRFGEGVGDLLVEVFELFLELFYFACELRFLFGQFLPGVVGKRFGRSVFRFGFGLLFFVLLAFLGFFLFPFFFVEPEFGLGARVRMKLFVVDFYNSCGKLVEEVAVMGDDYKRALVIT